MKKGRKSSQLWLKRQENDPYVKRARIEGWRSRAVFKLSEIMEKDKFLKPSMTCVDLGASPGGWSQYISSALNGNVKIIAVDLIPMDELPSVKFICGDFTKKEVLNFINESVGKSGIDLVISDMAPNITGMKAVDQPRSMWLAENAFNFACSNLVLGGDFICKVFQGQGTDQYINLARKCFSKVKMIKPCASRSKSSEMYVVARNFQL